MKFYNDWALRISAGEWTDGRAFYGLPGYAYVLAVIYRIIGFDPFTIGLIQTVIFAGVAVIIFRLGVESADLFNEDDPGSSRRSGISAGLIAAIGWIIFVPGQVFSVILMPTIWLILAYWVLVFWISRPGRRSVPRPWLAIGLIVGVIATMVATILFVLPLAILAVIQTVGLGAPARRRWLQQGVALSILFAGVGIGTSPAWIHNYVIAREPVMLSAHSGINMWIGNNPVANGYPRIPPGIRASQEGLLRDSVTLAQNAAGRPLKRYEVSRYWNEKTSEWILSNRSTWLRLLGTKIENFVNALQYDDLSTIKLLQTAGVLLPGLKFGLVAALGIPGLALAAWRSRRARWVAAAVLLHLGALLPVFVTERYRLAAVPGLLIGVGYGLSWMYQTLIGGRSWYPIVGWLSAGAAATAIVTVPRGDPGFWSLDHYKAGIRALDLREMNRAQTELETAYSYVPNDSEINFALGNFWYTKRDLSRAKAFYQAALKLDPTHGSAFNNLGVVMLEEGNWDMAARLFEKALSIEPEDPVAYYLLATAYSGAGKLELARKAIAEAVRLRPSQAEFITLQTKLAPK